MYIVRLTTSTGREGDVEMHLVRLMMSTGRCSVEAVCGESCTPAWRLFLMMMKMISHSVSRVCVCRIRFCLSRKFTNSLNLVEVDRTAGDREVTERISSQ